MKLFMFYICHSETRLQTDFDYKEEREGGSDDVPEGEYPAAADPGCI